MIFTADLEESLKTNVELQMPSTLEDVMALACAYEHRSIVPAPPPATTTLRSSNSLSGSSITPPPRHVVSTTPRVSQR
jgi:hypothetical protein